MQGNRLLQNNHIKVQGFIVTEAKFSHEVYGESFYTLDIEILRLSDVKDILPITISERLINKDELQLGKVVNISGQVRSYNNFIEEERRNRLILTIFVRGIEVLGEEKEMNPNEVFLNGYICKEPVYRSTPFGREICDLLIAVNRAYNKSDYIPCIAWGRNARFASTLEVGNNIKILGRMQSRTYQKKISEEEILERVAYEISVSKIELNREDEELVNEEEDYIVLINEEDYEEETDNGNDNEEL